MEVGGENEKGTVLLFIFISCPFVTKARSQERELWVKTASEKDTPLTVVFCVHGTPHQRAVGRFR